MKRRGRKKKKVVVVVGIQASPEYCDESDYNGGGRPVRMRRNYRGLPGRRRERDNATAAPIIRALSRTGPYFRVL